MNEQEIPPVHRISADERRVPQELEYVAYRGGLLLGELMQGFKRDGGDPMGIMPTALVVPPSLQSDAEKILKVAQLENGGGNINYNKVELIVNSWLE